MHTFTEVESLCVMCCIQKAYGASLDWKDVLGTQNSGKTQ
jgi:hypothetical protein